MKTKKSITIIPLKSPVDGGICYDIKMPHLKIDCHLVYFKGVNIHRGGNWILSCFNSKIKSALKAHMDSISLEKGNQESPDWNEVMNELEELKNL
jgi:hypothetical protein